VSRSVVPAPFHRLWRFGAAALIAAALAVTFLPFARPSLAARPAAHPHTKALINIGAKNFDEEYIIADMYQLLLQKKGFQVKQHVLGSDAPPFQKALLRGQIDLYPEYTGTGLTVILGKPSIANPIKAYDTVKNLYQKKYHLTWLEQAPMNDTNAVAVTQATASKYHLTNLSSLAKVASKLKFAALPECKGRPDCLGGLQKVYGINFSNVTYVTSTTLTLQALRAGQVDAAEVFGTDGRIKAYGLVSLPDDKAKVFPADHIAPVVRNSILKKYPVIRATLNSVAPYLTNKAVIRLNQQFDLNHVDAMTLARQFLKSKHLI
jgi:osmoprotectant transport system substrate-binding protein